MVRVTVLLLCGLFLAFTAKAQPSPCSADSAFHIVVLGSSTAAGAGASPIDSAWVNRYRDYLTSINPANQVTNRAQGGFTTYQLMRTGFIPPAGRPDPNTTRNITYGLSLNPDAIIVNLPSNDVASGFSVAEQLNNFDSIVSQANAAGVPIWICTTQPRDFGGNMTNIQAQLDVRDSIWARYAPRVLDFWTGLPDNTNQLANSPYNSGDGVHLNNGGHNLLFGRVRDADIPGMLYQAPPYADWVLGDLSLINPALCGDSLAEVQLSFYNRGTDSLVALPLDLWVEHLNSGQQTFYSDTYPATLSACTTATFSFFVNTLQGGDYLLTGRVGPGDPQAHNDTLHLTASILGNPDPQGWHDSACVGDMLFPQVLVDPADSVRWYDVAVGGSPIAFGPGWWTPPLFNTTTYYAEALRGDYVYRNSLASANSTNINFNGTMFDLVADSALVLDSIGIKINTLGTQGVDVFTRSGSHLGYETNASAWTFLGTYTADVINVNDAATISLPGIPMAIGDSLALYLQLNNPAADLSYQSGSQPITRQTNELTMITGSGSAHNFGGNYYPRDWSGEIYYHFGSKPNGDCQSDRIAVQAVVSEAIISLGPDSILDVNDSIALTVGGGFASQWWSNGETSETIWLVGNDLGIGIYPISVQVTDSFGCTGGDTIIVVFAPLANGLEEYSAEARVWPNPATNVLKIEANEAITGYKVLSMQGAVVKKGMLQGVTRGVIPLEGLSAGYYRLELEVGGRLVRKAFIKR